MSHAESLPRGSVEDDRVPCGEEGCTRFALRFATMCALHLENPQDWRAAVVAHKHELEGAYLEETDLRDLDLSGARLKKADLWGARLEGASLDGAELTTADGTNLRLENASLKNANLEGMNLTRAQLGGADLSGACLDGAECLEMEAPGAKFAGAHCEETNLRRAVLEGADLSGAKIIDSDMWETKLSRANFTGAELRESQLACSTGANVIFKNANLRAAKLPRVEWDSPDLSGADFCGADLEGAILKNIEADAQTILFEKGGALKIFGGGGKLKGDDPLMSPAKAAALAPVYEAFAAAFDSAARTKEAKHLRSRAEACRKKSAD